jgi:type I restriction enzyme S subunit
VISHKKIKDLITPNQKSTYQVRSATNIGGYPFFTSGTKILRNNTALSKGENLYVSTGGKALIQYYDGEASYSTDCFSFKVNKEIIEPKFLYFFLNLITPLINEKMFKGMALKHLQKTEFLNIEVPILSLETQRGVVKRIELISAEIDKSITYLEKNLSNTNDILAKHLENVFTMASNDWKQKEFGEIIDFLTDYHANGSYEVLKENVELKDSENFAWMVRSTDFENNFENNLRYIDQKSYDFLAKTKIFGGELIMSKIGNAGKVYLMPQTNKPCSLAMNLFLIRLNKKYALSEFIYNYLKSPAGEKQIKSRLLGMATKTITKDNVRNIVIPIPPLNTQEKIVNDLNKLRHLLTQVEKIYQQKINKLIELKQSILKQAFNGELVKD